MRGFVLGVDTAGPVVSAAIHAEGQTLAAWSERIVRGADGVLMPAIAELLAQADADGFVLSRVAVSTGPGGFTGLRVGVATALGVAVARGVHVVAVSSLAARAALAPGEPLVLSLLDARKSRVYAGRFDTRGETPHLLGEERDIAPAEALPTGPFLAVGEGALVYADAVRAAGGRVATDAGAGVAAAVARLGALGSPVDAGRVQLRYIRPPDAKVPRQLAGVQPARTG
jgi:tRNA threonylcarbamoyladenosine biosynthesis protein TsaB